MKMTSRTKEILRIRKSNRDMLKEGWEYVGESGGNLWELYRGGRYNHIISEVKISACGKALWIKTKKEGDS